MPTIPFLRKQAPEADVVLKPGTYRVRAKRTPDSAHDVAGWYERWRERIHGWVRRHADETLASVVMLVPDMLVLSVRLAKDPRVPWTLKGQLALAVAYVLSPFDLIPEALVGVVGLADDAGVLALVLYALRSLSGVDTAVLRENWPGSGDVETVIDSVHEQIVANRRRIMSDRVWRVIERRFGRRALGYKR